MAEVTSYGISTGTSLMNYDSGTQYRTADPFTASNLTWTELTSSTPEDWAGVKVEYNCESETILAIAIGSAGNEVIIGVLDAMGGFAAWEIIPVPVPAGSRVSWACVSWTIQYAYCAVSGLKSTGFPADPAFTILESGPYYLDGTGGNYIYAKTLTAPGSNNTKGAWTEISYSGTNSTANNVLNGDSLDETYDYLGVKIFGDYYGYGGWMGHLFDLGYGAAASEVVHAENQPFRKQINGLLTGHTEQILWFPWGRSAGDRIAMRYQCEDVTKIGTLRARLFGLR